MRLDALQTFVKNPRRGDVSAIAESLRVRGQYRPVVVNVGTLTGRTNEVLAGNHTVLAARSLEWESVSAALVDVDDAGAAQIVLADNRLADLGTYDDADLLAVLEQAADLTGTGYSQADLDALIAASTDPVSLTDPDAVPPVPVEPVSVVGDVWELGEHRLAVGSSGDLELVRSALPEGVVIDCVWTDPPYGVEYVGGTGMTIQNDGKASALQVFREFLDVAVAVSRPGAPVYVAHADVMRLAFEQALVAAGCSWRQTLMWVKDRMVLSRSDYHYKTEPILEGVVGDDAALDYEPIGYGFTRGGSGRLGRGGPRWYGDNRGTTVFEVKRPSASSEHPTMKPTELIEAMLERSCAPGAWVFDGFGGSGSTMIAAHRLGRRSLLVELDTHYADVICRRWQEHTGIVPVRAGVEVDFLEV